MTDLFWELLFGSGTVVVVGAYALTYALERLHPDKEPTDPLREELAILRSELNLLPASYSSDREAVRQRISNITKRMNDEERQRCGVNPP